MKAGHSAAFKCSISVDTTKRVGYCFVDDSTIVQIGPSPNTPTQDTVKISQEGLNIFVGAARAAGGQVSVQKTRWYLLDFNCNPEVKWHLEKNNSHLSLKTQEGDKHIEILTPSQASRILGVWISPKG